MLAYFIKVNIALALFYAFYRLFCYRDTFFGWRRTALLCFFAVSVLYPLLNIETWMVEQEPMTAIITLYSTVILPELTVGTTADGSIDWNNVIPAVLLIIYIGVAAMLLMRMLMQLVSLARLTLHTPVAKVDGIRVHLLKQPSAPFSFFRLIFVCPEQHTDTELYEILTHEQTHVTQWHSVDVLIGEMACVLCWFNPFVWLMKREIRVNLEYLADNRVLETGCDCKAYQYHLLGLAHPKAAATIYNSFNVLPLKKRISMMNKQRTRNVGRTKYLMFIPLAALLMLVSNIETVARSIQTAEQNDDLSLSPDTVSPVVVMGVGKSSDKVFEIVEQMPEFPDGGMSALMTFLVRNIKYPTNAVNNKTQGRVVVSFVVEKDGSITSEKVTRSVDPELDGEALRVIRLMPKWKPGMQRGEKVRVQYTVPVMFRLDADKKSVQQPQVVGAKVLDDDGKPYMVGVKANNNLEEVVVVSYDDGKLAEKIYTVVDKMPEFPDGGMQGLMRYLSMNIRYPINAMKQKVEGRVIVQFVVDKDGSISEPFVAKGVDADLNNEALRVVKAMPNWIPGTMKGEPVRVKYTMPVSFKLSKPAKSQK
ncbi:MAG: M56 family metallopeptidase [Prevotellaceae bacterium]|jgi:TonB family protein|nr:M56 family metallopeptidase [Prevotellaceae bacterium]